MIRNKIGMGIAFYLCVSITLFTSAFAYALKGTPIEYSKEDDNKKDPSVYFYYEDFNSYSVGDIPNVIVPVVSGDTSVTIVQTQLEAKKEGNALRIKDNASGGNVGFNLNYQQQNQPILFEMRFKFVKGESEYLSFTLDFYSGNSWAYRLAIFSSGWNGFNYTGSTESETITGGQLLESDVWYTLKACMDPESNTADVLLESEALKKASTVTSMSFKMDKNLGVSMGKGLPYFSEFNGGAINNLKFLTTSGTGEYYIDYMLLENNGKLIWPGPPPEKIIPPYTKQPGILPVLGTVNVNFKGTYMYFSSDPFVENGTVYVSARDLAAWYRMQYVKKDGKYIISDSQITVEMMASSSDIMVNGKKNTLENQTVVRTNSFYVPTLWVSVIDFAKVMGDLAEYQNEKNLVTITKGGI